MTVVELYNSLGKFVQQQDFGKTEVLVYYLNPETGQTDYLTLGGVGFADHPEVDAVVLVDLLAITNTNDKHIKFPDE